VIVLGWALAGIAAFFVVAAVLYLAVSDDEAGQAMLVVSVAFAALVAVALLRWGRAAPTPADRGDADPGDDAGAEGAAGAGPSLWPLLVGLATTSVAIGFVLGSWWLVPSALVLLVALVGFSGLTPFHR
jgi:hypothetical protein